MYFSLRKIIIRTFSDTKKCHIVGYVGIWLRFLFFYTFALVIRCYMSTLAQLRNSSVLEPESDVVAMQAGVLAIGAAQLAVNCKCTAQATVHQWIMLQLLKPRALFANCWVKWRRLIPKLGKLQPRSSHSLPCASQKIYTLLISSQ